MFRKKRPESFFEKLAKGPLPNIPRARYPGESEVDALFIHARGQIQLLKHIIKASEPSKEIISELAQTLCEIQQQIASSVISNEGTPNSIKEEAHKVNDEVNRALRDAANYCSLNIIRKKSK